MASCGGCSCPRLIRVTWLYIVDHDVVLQPGVAGWVLLATKSPDAGRRAWPIAAAGVCSIGEAAYVSVFRSVSPRLQLLDIASDVDVRGMIGFECGSVPLSGSAGVLVA
jgi:hypothetical protein